VFISDKKPSALCCNLHKTCREVKGEGGRESTENALFCENLANGKRGERIGLTLDTLSRLGIILTLFIHKHGLLIRICAHDAVDNGDRLGHFVREGDGGKVSFRDRGKRLLLVGV